MNNHPGNTNEPTPEQVQSCPPAGSFLDPDIVATPSVSRAAGRPAAQGRAVKGGGIKVVSSCGSTISRSRKSKGPKKPPKKKRIQIKTL
jgi:hypothetical protein